ncbi:hypothetical protein N7455_000446 [Penicillium solitum]|uniref:uncharacterized protein n=1 Tax=Penicillium solitum TaxID=60172 RepID=UPI0018372DD9|nr:hypothetical protein HAV15_006290 [Penicillium sp. str. \
MASNSSSKPRAKKRPRLSNESSNESPGSSLEPNPLLVGTAKLSLLPKLLQKPTLHLILQGI